MKKPVIYLLLILSSLQGYGQLFPLSDNYLSNMLAINPAFAGNQDALSTAMSYRSQWAGFTDAPKDLTFTAHAPIRNDRMGLGFVIDRVTAGLFSTTDISGSYALRMELSDGVLALGLGLGASFYNISWNSILAADSDDQMLLNGRQASVLPDFSFGVYYHTKKLFAGFSVPRFLTHEYNKTSGTYRMKNDFSEYTFLLSGGYFAKMNELLTLFPSAVVSYNPGHDPLAIVNANVILRDKVWLGAGYKSTNAVTGMLRLRVNYQLMVAYSYCMDLGSLGKYSSGSHEVVLGYVFRYLRDVAGPRNF